MSSRVIAYKMIKWLDSAFSEMPPCLRPTEIMNREELAELIDSMKLQRHPHANDLNEIKMIVLRKSDAWQNLRSGLQEVKGIGQRRGQDLNNVIWHLLEEQISPGQMIKEDPDVFYQRWHRYTSANHYTPPSREYVKSLREWWIENA